MRTLFLLSISSLLFSCTNCVKNEITFSNPSSFERMDEQISLLRSDSVFKNCANDMLPLILCNEDTIPSQLLDTNGDSQWDRLLMNLNFAALEIKKVEIVFVESTAAPVYAARTNFRFAKKKNNGKEFEECTTANRLAGKNTDTTQKYFQFEGPGWENDKVAFRNYFDERNGIDIFGKKLPGMILDRVGVDQNYHELQSWGMDILKVGSSLGAGAIAVKNVDSLYRVSQYKESNFDGLSEGILQTTFNLNYNNFMVDSQLINIHHKVEISAGKYFYNNEISISEMPKNMQLVVGIVNLHSDTMYQENYLNHSIFYTHDKQAFNGEYLGMAVVAKKTDCAGFYKTPNVNSDVTNTFAVQFVSTTLPLSYRFYSCWELNDKKFSNREAFISFLKNEVDRSENPIVRK